MGTLFNCEKSTDFGVLFKDITQPMIGEMKMSQNEEISPAKTLAIKAASINAAYSNHNQINQLDDITNEKFSSKMDTIRENPFFINHQDQVIFYKCNELGHYSYECPQKTDKLFTVKNANDERYHKDILIHVEPEMHYDQPMYERDFEKS